MPKKLILRDYLAIDRTNLANERTLLSYYRTALACIALGPFIIRFFPSWSSLILAVCFILSGVGIAVYGTKRFYILKKRIRHQ